MLLDLAHGVIISDLVVKNLESRRHVFHRVSFPDESHHGTCELFGSEPQNLIAESLKVFQNMETHRKHGKNVELDGSALRISSFCHFEH